jgi:hypothetical protein
VCSSSAAATNGGRGVSISPVPDFFVVCFCVAEEGVGPEVSSNDAVGPPILSHISWASWGSGLGRKGILGNILVWNRRCAAVAPCHNCELQEYGQEYGCTDILMVYAADKSFCCCAGRLVQTNSPGRLAWVVGILIVGNPSHPATQQM